MSLSVLSSNLFFIGILFVFGWWARYFRTPARRAWLVDVPRPEYRSKIFGFLHALDVGGGMLAVLYSVILVMLGFPLQQIIFLTRENFWSLEAILSFPVKPQMNLWNCPLKLRPIAYAKVRGKRVKQPSLLLVYFFS